MDFYRKTCSYGKIIHPCADGLPHTLCHTISTNTGGKVQKDPLADCFISGSPSEQTHVMAFPVADTGLHGDRIVCGQLLSPALGCLQSQRPSGGRCQCGLQRWGLSLSRWTEMKRKEGRRGRTLKTHSGRPEATDLPQFQWGNSENKTFHGPSQNPKTCDTHIAFVTRINKTALLIGKATEVGSHRRGQGVRKPYFRLDIPHCG